MKKIFDGVFKENNRLFTQNKLPGKKVYGEESIRLKGVEYREWIPNRSKLAAAILNGIKKFPLNSDSKVLYLGAASGTTVSHISDICLKGQIYAVEFSARVTKNLLDLSKNRDNIIPILANARIVKEISQFISEVDLIYQDIAQKDQVQILIRNSNAFLKNGSIALLCLKAKSVSSTEKVSKIYEQELKKLKEQFEIIKKIDLAPHEKDHLFLVLRKK